MRMFLKIICWKCEKENKFKQTLLWCTLASGPVHQWDGSCVMICSSSSQRKGAPTGVCCQTLQSIWVARRRSWASFQDWNVGTVQRHRVVFCLWFVTTSEFHQLHVDVLCPRQLQTDYWDLVCHRLAAWKVTQVSLQHIHLPQAQLHTESGKGSLHVCDHMVPALKLGVQMSLFIQELCGDSPSAFLKLADFLT